MKKLLYIISCGCLLMASCNNKKERKSEEAPRTDSAAVPAPVNKDSCKGGLYIKYAHDYNNFMIDNQGFILESHVDFIKALKANESQETIDKLYNDLVRETNISIDTVNKLCAFNGNIAFKNAGIELFKYYQEAWADYKPILAIVDKKEKASAEGKLKLKFDEYHSKKEKELEEKFMNAHTDFVNENHLHIRSTSLHSKLDSLFMK